MSKNHGSFIYTISVSHMHILFYYEPQYGNMPLPFKVVLEFCMQLNELCWFIDIRHLKGIKHAWYSNC